MKIRKVTPENHNKVYGLFRKGFPGKHVELNKLKKLHRDNKVLYEWSCIHTNKNIAYIAFVNAFDKSGVCGLQLIYHIVRPDFQGRGIGTELLSFALRQKVLENVSIYVFGDSKIYKQFGIENRQYP